MGSAQRFAALAWLLAAATAAGQDTGTAPPKEPTPAAWSFSANAYFIPQDTDYLDPVVTADHGALHLEGRYNYEALRTGSFFVGWTLHFGGALSLDLTPMVGGVFGDLDGIAPGYELTLVYKISSCRARASTSST